MSKENDEIFTDGEFRLEYTDKLCIINNLKRLDMLIDNEKIITLMTKKELLKYQICYYAISVLSTNSYKVYIEKLTREMLLNKYLKTEEYCRNEEKEEKVKYLIKSLQNELEYQKKE